MNFFFGHIHKLSIESGRVDQEQWLSKTIFANNMECITHHIEDGFSLSLVNDPKKLCSYQSRSIHVDEKYVCATDCQLFNKDELADKLGISTTTSNEDFFITAYLKWGKEFPDHFDGKFSFVIWDKTNKVLLAGLDALGYGNFSYSQVGNNFYFSSDLATLLDQPKVDKTVNMKRFYQCFRYSNNTPEQTYFQHCNYCPPGHVLRIEKSKVETFDYWQLSKINFPEYKKDESTYTQEFISLLRKAIEKECHGKPNLGLMLSGGYDSSLLAAMLAQEPDWKSNLTCYSYTFEKFKSCDESKHIKQTLDQLNLAGMQLNADDKHFLADAESRLTTIDIVNMDAYSALPDSLYKQAKNDNKDIIISGLNGDDLFGGVRYMYADLLLAKQYGTVIKKIGSSNNKLTAIEKLFNYGLRPLLPGWVKSLYRMINPAESPKTAFNIEHWKVNNVDGEEKLMASSLFHHRNLLKLVYYRNVPESLHFIRKRLYFKCNLEHLMPYYNKNMIEFMWQLPMEFLETNGRFRGLQINALNLYNLNHIADRIDKTVFEELLKSGIANQKHLISKIKRSSSLINKNIIEPKYVDDIFDQIGKTPTGISIIYFVLAELWLKQLTENIYSFNKPYEN